ncbi:ligated ion channel l-glutamate- and glycine-binding site domain-containing protein [Ditylenchus destructor]|nr:ligated ion channel l-glutamate- and glycine-binding site domain-containing protein [Ditylenchus destructor]
MERSGVTHLFGGFNEDLEKILEGLACESKVLTYVRPAQVQNWKSIKNAQLRPRAGCIMDMFPQKAYLSMTINLLKYWHWDRFSIVYLRSAGLHRFSSLFSLLSATIIFVEVDDLGHSTDLTRPYLEAGRKMKRTCDLDNCWRKLNRAIIDLPPRDTLEFLRASLMLGMINVNNWYLLVSIDDLGNSHMAPFSHNQMRLSTTSQVDWASLVKNESYSQSLSTFRHLFSQTNPGNFGHIAPMKDFAFIHDTMLYVTREYEDYSFSPNWGRPYYIEGLTGPIRLDNNSANRLDAVFYVHELSVDGEPIKTGVWRTNSAKRTNELSMQDKLVPNTHESRLEESRTQRFLRVTTILEKPYVMEKISLSSSSDPTGKVVYEGFCIDLLNRLSYDLNFEYQLSIVADGKYGDELRENSTGEGTGRWNGMIGEILRQEADVAVAPITVTAGRLEVVDFTNPFLQLGISMLMRQPDEKPSSFLSFLWPLSPTVWVYSAVVTICTALSMVAVSVLSPSESSHVFNIMNSLWYLLCILLRAGSGYNCRSVSNRLMSAVWWMFTLILIAQYTANFAAVLTIDRKSLPFNSFEELGNQTDYSFGAIAGGSTQQFFMYSRLDTFRNIWLRMSNMSKVFVTTNDEGVQKALNERYVFLMESTSLEFQLTQHCNLTKVGNIVLGSNGYSIALPKGSKWREQLSRQILDYNERGVMMMLKNKWWKKTPQTEECEEKTVETKKSLGMDKASGIFALLIIGPNLRRKHILSVLKMAA